MKWYKAYKNPKVEVQVINLVIKNKNNIYTNYVETIWYDYTYNKKSTY